MNNTFDSTTTYATALPIQPIPPPSVDGSQSYSKNNKSNGIIKLPEQRDVVHDNKQIQQLVDEGFTVGLAKSLSVNVETFPYRIWIIDNSGSMQKDDGHKIVTSTASDVRIVPCTRWDEIRSCVNYHIRLAGGLEAPTAFRLLNHPGAAVGDQFFSVASDSSPSNHDDKTVIARDMQHAKSIMGKARPGGCTPLTNHIMEIYGSLQGMAPELQKTGKRVAIILATDGLPTDERAYGGPTENQQFVEALRLLEGLPVWLVIRLCTDDEDVVSFYNELDNQLELNIEVLDDFCAEAAEVYEHNAWLNYALPLHRCREMGYYDRVFDLIDNRSLTRSDIRDFCAILFGHDNMDGIPDPDLDWMGFTSEVNRLLKKEKMQWNPLKKKATPWIDMKKLNQQYGNGAGCNGCVVS